MSTAPDSPKASKLGTLGSSFWLILLALAVIVFGANTGVATYEGSRLSGAGTGAADLQVLSQQLANQGREAVAGNAESRACSAARMVSREVGMFDRHCARGERLPQRLQVQPARHKAQLAYSTPCSDR